jgi:hypothetical protein
MDNPGRSLRSRLVVEPKRSPEKAPKITKKKKTARDSAKTGGGGRNGGAKSSKIAKLTEAMQQAKEYLAEESEEEFVEKAKGKRTRKKDGEGELLTTAEVTEANRMALEAMKTDKYALESDERRIKVAEDIARYESKANLAKERLKGPQLEAKLKEIGKKLESLYQLQTIIKDYALSRQDELLTGALEAIMAEKHANKKRRASTDDSEAEELEVSEG